MRFDEFLKEREYLLGVSPKTLIYYRCAFNSWTKHATDGTVLTWISGMKHAGLSNISINTYICAMRAYFKWAEPQRPKIAYLKEEQKLLQVFTDADITKLIRFKPRSQTMKRVQALALLLADTGLRISEALALTESDIDMQGLLVRVKGKGQKFRQVPISVEGRKVLYTLNRGKTVHYIFATESGSQLSVRNALRDVKTLCRQVGVTGVRCSPHTFRHFFAVSYLRNGGNLFYLSRILGHTSIKTTQTYLKSLGMEDIGAVHNGLSPLSARR